MNLHPTTPARRLQLPLCLVMILSAAGAQAAPCDAWNQAVSQLTVGFAQLPSRSPVQSGVRELAWTLPGWSACQVEDARDAPLVRSFVLACNRPVAGNLRDAAEQQSTAILACFPDAVFYRPTEDPKWGGHQLIRLVGRAAIEIGWEKGSLFLDLGPDGHH